MIMIKINGMTKHLLNIEELIITKILLIIILIIILNMNQ